MRANKEEEEEEEEEGSDLQQIERGADPCATGPGQPPGGKVHREAALAAAAVSALLSQALFEERVQPQPGAIHGGLVPYSCDKAAL